MFNILTIIIAVTALVSYMAFNNNDLKYRYMYIPYKVKHDHQGYRILSHVLIHADLTHLLFNLFSLYFLGRVLLGSAYNPMYVMEPGLIQEYGLLQGQLHFLALYMLGALFATLIPYLRHQDNSNYMSLGASGAVSAVIFAAILWDPGMKLGLFFLPGIAIPAYIFGPLYILFELWSDKRGGSNIAHDAHIGGALFGIVYVLIINIDKGKQFIDLVF